MVRSLLNASSSQSFVNATSACRPSVRTSILNVVTSKFSCKCIPNLFTVFVPVMATALIMAPPSFLVSECVNICHNWLNSIKLNMLFSYTNCYLNIHSVPHNSNSLISNYRLFRRPPSAPKITPLAKLTLLQRKMAKIRLSRIKSSAFKISSYAGPSVVCCGNSHNILFNMTESVSNCR